MPVLTPEFLDLHAKAPTSGQIIYRDEELKGFALRVTPRSKSYIVEKRVGGANKRITIGKPKEMSVHEARQIARKLILKIDQGFDPATGLGDRSNAITLSEVMQKYFEIRSLRPISKRNYGYLLRRSFPDWMNMSVTSISKQMVEDRHRDLSVGPRQRGASGKTQADYAMRVLGCMLSFASERYGTDDVPLLKANPVSRLSKNRAWHQKGVRQGTIPAHQLASWYRAVISLQNATARDCLLLLIMTGLRRGECISMRWENVDFGSRMLKLPGTVTKNGYPHELPLSNFLIELLENRYHKRVGSDFVFPGRAADRHMIDLDFPTAKVRAKIGSNFLVHDLRRTFVSMAAQLSVPDYVIKRLVNHHSSSDITQRYIIADPERLRGYMQQITDAFLELMDYKKLKFTPVKDTEQATVHQLTLTLGEFDSFGKK